MVSCITILISILLANTGLKIFNCFFITSKEKEIQITIIVIMHVIKVGLFFSWSREELRKYQHDAL